MGNRFFISDFYCTYCGQRGIPLARKYGKAREPGHLKKLYCLHCKAETNHVEIRPYGKYTYEDFYKEFISNTFKNGLRVEVE